MQYFSCGSDKYSEIKMCDLEPFSKIQSHIMSCDFPYRLVNNTKLLSFIVLCFVSLCIPVAYPQAELCNFKLIKLDVQIRPVFASSVTYVCMYISVHCIAR